MTANLEWTKLLGTSTEDYSTTSATTGNGFIYIAGPTYGDLEGNTNKGGYDAFLSKISEDGELIWTKLIGAEADESGFSISANANGVYLAGGTASEQTTSLNNISITRIDADGNSIWTKSYHPGYVNEITHIASSASEGALLTGYYRSTASSTQDYEGFAYKLDSTGEIIWQASISSPGNDQPQGIATAGNDAIYVTGFTSGNLNGNTNNAPPDSNPFYNPYYSLFSFDAFITKLNGDGSTAWTHLIGTSSHGDYGWDVTTGADGSAYVVGDTDGNLDGETNNGTTDAFVSKFDQSGNKIWTRLIGTSQVDSARSVTSDENGSIYVAGTTTGTLPGQSNAGGTGVGDTFLAKLGADGTLRWILQYGSENLDEAFSVSTPGNGSIYLSGATYGNLGGQQNASLAAGRLDADAFITRFSDPEFLDSNKTGTSDQYSSPQSSTSTPATTVTPATAGIDPIPESQPSISPPPPAPPSSSPILGIEPQETIKTVGLPTPLVIGSLKIDQVVVGTVARDLITGSDIGEALAGGQGKDKMTGGGGPDAFLFETPGEFGKKKADTITDFRPEEGDKIAIAKGTFSDVSKIKLDTATGKQETRTAASTNKNFIYDDKSGILYFNENGRKAGFGNGGEFAQLLGAPDISKGDLVLL